MLFVPPTRTTTVIYSIHNRERKDEVNVPVYVGGGEMKSGCLAGGRSELSGKV